MGTPLFAEDREIGVLALSIKIMPNDYKFLDKYP